jgi:hypothetical protein
MLGPLLFTLLSHHLLNSLHNIFNANKIPSAPSTNAQHFSDWIPRETIMHEHQKMLALWKELLGCSRCCWEETGSRNHDE